MLILDFHAKFTSIQEKSRLFDALRRLSRLDDRALMAADDSATGWPEWPPLALAVSGREKV
jgi:hypothetical protein